MLSPSSLALPRQTPPVRPSRSLEGLEQVVPPRVPVPPARPALRHIDKPLPELPPKPLPETPSMDEGSTAWSDDSSTISSFYDDSRRFSADSSESYPVFVRSGSDDLSELVDHPPTAGPIDPYQHDDHHHHHHHNDHPKSAPFAITTTFLHDDHSDRAQPWVTNRAGPNHYFREKKWDFFPELATPSALPTSPRFPTHPRKKNGSKLNLTVFDFTKSRTLLNSSDRSGRALAQDVRNSIRSYVQRRLSKNSLERNKSSRSSPPTADSVDPVRTPTPSSKITTTDEIYHPGSPKSPLSPVDVLPSNKRLSRMSTRSTMGARGPHPRPHASQRKKQLAVPMSPYQKYGAAIWEKPGREKRISYRQSHNVRFPRYRKRGSSKKGFVSSATPPLTPPARSQLQQNTRDCVRAIQDGTHHILDALDGARKKMIGVRGDRRHTELKSQIRLVGPVSPYNNNYRQTDPWI
ncbi:hypothetical protein CBS76997_176 [Aspergillus niger]|nr:hypothetical protein CBS13152_1677 [Aspergillus niger]KAI2975951.1 hypothetical protein CBS147323_935 [Aspergillus niger]KAI3033504.1 hypothetical protein CBS147347_601 [Aspergillus niger]KAI3053657.1 hypothetical protein CBS76997_176 [Aspergillus niger]